MLRHSGWRTHATYLEEETPLSMRQAEILALQKTYHTKEEIAETLKLPEETVDHHIDEIQEVLAQSKRLCTLVGPSPSSDTDVRTDFELDTMPWNLMTSGKLDYDDEERTRLELELYHGKWNTVSHTYLLVEREIVDIDRHETRTIEHRGAYGSEGLRATIYDDSESLDEYYLRYVLLELAGIDPTEGSARSPQAVLDQHFTEADADAARKRAKERVTRHKIESEKLPSKQ